VLDFLENPSLRDQFGKAGRHRAEALFGVETHSLSVLEAYQTVIATYRAKA